MPRPLEISLQVNLFLEGEDPENDVRLDDIVQGIHDDIHYRLDEDLEFGGKKLLAIEVELHETGTIPGDQASLWL